MSTTIPGDTSTTATITQGQVLNGELTFSGDSDWYRAEMTAGLDYGFKVSGDGSGSSLPDADLYLYDSTGNRLTGGTNYSQTSTSITYKAPASGPYYVGVTDSSDLGNYKLTWLGNDTVLRNAATTATLAQGQTFKSAIDVAGDSDWVKVELKAGLNYGFNVSGDGSQGSLPDGDLNLRDADGNVVVSGTNYSNSSYSIYDAAERTGAYYLEVADSSDTGNYKLSWLGNDTILRNNQTTVSLGSTKTHTSAIEVNGDSDWFKVKLEAGISYAFRVDGTGASKLPDGDVNIRDADGNIVSSGTNYSSSSFANAYTAEDDGVYFVEVTDSGGDIGKYKITNVGRDTIVNNTDTDRIIVEGGVTQSKIDANQDSDWHQLTVRKGRTYEFDLTGTGGKNGADDVYLALHDKNGDRLVYDNGDSATITWKADISGKIYLEAAGNSFSTIGDYKLSAVSNSPTLKGTSKDDNLTGGDNKTTISGLGGDDRLNGGGGNDRIIGGAGVDTLIGGGGKDVFVFAASDTGSTVKSADTILDFNVRQKDVIDLGAIDANTHKSGNQAFTFIGDDSFSKHAGELRVDKEKSDTWIKGDMNGDGKVDFLLHLDDSVKLTQQHFDL
ncbi:calcium-binding protein [Rhizobium sp. TRM95796]|uniref:calcium-binding protein n=1 Tax=Rhizobium sp. TRM95796 TaxID=2979862 RepID=UPI0021E8AEE0|nr:pre-peptidase C-terminal domain-containing protein [Rhizobium sp. TRM95796]MCV3764420.1 pre-peptidase C-terminal domain-containing protein [Rhizobium sp. TRM95796]